MAKLSKRFEKTLHLKSKLEQLQVLEIVAHADNREDAKELGYDEYECNLYINGKLIADISAVLDGAGLLVGLIDSVDWEEIYADNYYDRGLIF